MTHGVCFLEAKLLKKSTVQKDFHNLPDGAADAAGAVDPLVSHSLKVPSMAPDESNAESGLHAKL